ncbi:MAG: dTMP kinase [Thermoplasmata archaeon]|nr:MAG: dTMP kinase [Thermoplasmata archaeon]
MKRFVTFEGIDGSGKTTIIDRIFDELINKDYSVFVTCEPTDSWVGKCVQECIATNTDPVVTSFTFISDRILHGKEILSWLNEYDFVLCDRYAESTYAYQGAQLQDSIDDPIKWLMELSKNRFPIPDITFLFEIQPKLAMKRIQDRDELIPFEKVAFLKKVAKNYQRLIDDSRFTIIDATQSIEDITKRCLDVILSDK